MLKNFFKILILLAFVFVTHTQTQAETIPINGNQSYILLTFDDLYIKSWEIFVKRQKEYPDMRFSFFIAYLSDGFLPRHINDVRALQVNGNSIEFHTRLHKSIDSYTRPSLFMETEVIPMLNQWKQNQLNPVAFAYAQNIGSIYTDLLVYKHFKWIRRRPFDEKDISVFENDDFFLPSKKLCDGGPLHPFSLSHQDFNKHGTLTDRWIKILNRASANNETIITYSHVVTYKDKGRPSNPRIDYIFFEQLLELRKQLNKRGIKMISFEDLRRCQ